MRQKLVLDCLDLSFGVSQLYHFETVCCRILSVSTGKTALSTRSQLLFWER